MPTEFGSEQRITGLSVRRLSAAASGTSTRFIFTGQPAIAAPDTTGSGTARVIPASTVAPPPPPTPLFLRVLKHLLPRAHAWCLTASKPLRWFFEALVPTLDGVKRTEDLAFLDLFPQSTRRLAEWEGQFNLLAGLLNEQQRRDRLEAAWRATGSLSPRYLQELLQSLGFNVYVHEWWEPGTEPEAGTKQCVTPRNPFLYLASVNGVNSGVECGEPEAECGEAFAEAGTTVGPPGYPLVNKVRITRPELTTGAGEVEMACGEPEAECGAHAEVTTTEQGFPLPTDPSKWPYFVYIGGQTFPEVAAVPLARRDEFEATLLKYVRASNWIGVLVSYN